MSVIWASLLCVLQSDNIFPLSLSLTRLLGLVNVCFWEVTVVIKSMQWQSVQDG